MATQTIYCTKDAYTEAQHADTNYGTGQYISVDNRTALQSKGYFAFNIISGPVSANVTSVVLYLHQYGYASDVHLDIRRLTSTLSETGVTWNDPPTSTDTNKVQWSLDTQEDDWEPPVTITNLYKDAKDAGNELGLYFYPYYSDDNVDFSSRETSYDAYIVITYGITDYYVKTTGDDAKDGGSWANAWKTINKAATTVPDGKTVHIGFGTYDAEPAANKIAPQNVGASGIYYKPETAETGGGTGTVSVEQNT